MGDSRERRRPAGITRRNIEALANALLPGDPIGAHPIELIIEADERNINVRHFVAYLTFVDRLHGRLSVGDLQKYARRESSQLRLREARPGSLQLVFETLASDFGSMKTFMLLYLLLKYAPAAIESATRSANNVAQAYGAYQDAQLTRENRRRLRAQVEEDEKLAPLSSTAKQQLVAFLDEAYTLESRELSRAQRFAIRSVRRLVLRRPPD